MPAPTPKEVKHVADSTGSTSATTLTMTNAIAVGDRVYVIYTVNGYATGAFPLTENLGNTIGAAVAGSRPNSNSYAIYSYVATVGGTPTFTVTKNGGATSTVCTITAIVIAAADDQGVDGTYKLVNGTSSGASVTCYVTLDSSSIATNYLVAAMFCTNSARTTPTLNTEANASYTDSGALNDIVGPWYESYRVVTGTTSALGVFHPGWKLNKGNADEYFVVGFAIKGTSTDPTITGGTANPVHLSTGNTITGSNFGSNTGSASLVIGGVTQTVTGWTANTVTYTANRGTNLDDVAVNAVVTNSTGTASNSYALTGFDPPASYNYVSLTSVNATAAYRITAAGDLAIGNQLEWDNALVTVYNDGTYVADPSVTSFNVRAGVTTDGWGSLAVQNINVSAASSSSKRAPLRIGMGFRL